VIDLSRYEDRYSSIALGQSMRISWRQMKAVLFKPFSISRFLSFAILGLVSNLNGGSKHVELIYMTFPPIPLILLFISFLGSVFGWYGIGVILAGIVIWVFFEARFRLIYLRSIGEEKIHFLKSWKKLKVPGRSFFLWELAIALLLSANVICMFLFPYAFSDVWYGYGVPFFFLAMFGSLFFLAFIDFSARRLILPLMCIKNIRFLDALRLFLKLYRNDKKPFIRYFFASFAIHAGVVIIFLVVSIAVSWLMMLLPDILSDVFESEDLIIVIFVASYILMKLFFSIVMLPLQMWYQGWGLAFYGGFGDDFVVKGTEP